jgi:hypothetical protein
VYDYFQKVGKIADSATAYMAALTGGVAYDVIVPVGPSGIAFLGDLGKFVPLGKKRITQLSDNGTLSVSIAFASMETAVTLRGYGPAKPTVTATTGSVGAVAYDAATKLFTVSVSGSGGTASIALH